MIQRKIELPKTDTAKHQSSFIAAFELNDKIRPIWISISASKLLESRPYSSLWGGANGLLKNENQYLLLIYMN